MNCQLRGKPCLAYPRFAIDNKESAMPLNNILQPRQQLLGLALATDENCACSPHYRPPPLCKAALSYRTSPP